VARSRAGGLGCVRATGAAALTASPWPNPPIENLFRASGWQRLRRTGLAPATYDVIMRVIHNFMQSKNSGEPA
jgi:hypothetical protein